VLLTPLRLALKSLICASHTLLSNDPKTQDFQRVISSKY